MTSAVGRITYIVLVQTLNHAQSTSQYDFRKKKVNSVLNQS